MHRRTIFTMTRERTWTLTATAVALFVLLSAIFADGLFAPPFWRSEDWMASPLITYVLILAIILAGWYQARGLPAAGIPLRVETTLTPGQVNDPARWRFLMGNIYFALIWLPVRLFVGREWFSNGARKITDPAWMGDGKALRTFWSKAVVVPDSGQPPITFEWYRNFLQYMLDNGWYTWFAKLIAVGEFLVAVGLILGALAGLAAFFGIFMNFSYLLAGSASTNPVLFTAGIFLVMAWAVAGYWGLDRWLLPMLGTRWAVAQAQVDAVAERAAREETGPRLGEPRPGTP